MSITFIRKLLLEEEADVEDIGKVVEEGDWESDYKDYAYKSTVVQVAASDLGMEEGFYRITYMRSGSYYTDYEYELDNVIKVEPVEITVTKYVPIHLKENANGN